MPYKLILSKFSAYFILLQMTSDFGIVSDYMIYGKEMHRPGFYSVNVNKPKLKTYFMREFGEDVLRVAIDRDLGNGSKEIVTVTRMGNYMNVSAPERAIVDRFLAPFDGEGKKNASPRKSSFGQ